MSLQSMIFKFMCTKSDRKRDKNLRIPENVTVIRDIAYDSRGQLLDLNALFRIDPRLKDYRTLKELYITFNSRNAGNPSAAKAELTELIC